LILLLLLLLLLLLRFRRETQEDYETHVVPLMTKHKEVRREPTFWSKAAAVLEVFEAVQQQRQQQQPSCRAL
jgi:hypothetical protein